jgi:hypothetical protein
MPHIANDRYETLRALGFLALLIASALAIAFAVMGMSVAFTAALSASGCFLAVLVVLRVRD